MISGAGLQLDHIFVTCDVEAPELAALAAIGLDGPPRRGRHEGQGTANACVVFENAFLELIWVHDEREARSPLTAPTRLWDRWAARRAGACPFGIGLRPATPGATPPYATWRYRPTYLPAGMSIDFPAGAALEEPELFFMTFMGARPDFRELAKRHTLAPGPITSVTIDLPGAAPLSPACAALQGAGVVSFGRAERHVLRIGCGARAVGRSADLRPTLPIVLDW